MFQGRDLAKIFRSIPFSSPKDIDAFRERAGEPTAAEIAKLLPALIELGARSPAPVQTLRCQAFALYAAAVGPELFTPCLRALRSADAFTREALVPLIVKINDVAGHNELCELLSMPDGNLRSTAGDILKQVGGRTALELLTRKALEPQFPGRMEAMAALVTRAGSQALPLLAAVVRAGRPMEKIHALRYLAQRDRFVKDLHGAVDTAVLALAERDDLVVAQAIATLGQLQPESVMTLVEPHLENRGIEVLRAFVTHCAQHTPDGVVNFFRARMRAGPKAVRMMLLDVLEQSGTEALASTLLDALANRDVAVRSRAVHAITELARRDRIDAARAIIWLLRSRDVNVRRVATEIANQIGDRDGSLAPRLLRFLRDEDWWVRERILDALVEMSGSGLTKFIITEYLSDPSDAVRRFAVSALLRIKDPRSLGALVRTAQSDADWLVAELAAEALGRVGDARAIPYLVELLESRPELRVATIESLLSLRAATALQNVADLLQDEEADVRAAAIHMLDELDDGTHALWVKGLEDDPSPTVREAAGRLLRRLKLERSVEGDHLADIRSLDLILSHMVARQADDLFLAAGKPPAVKRMGRVEPLGSNVLSGATIRDLLMPQLSPEQRQAFEAGKEVDFSYTLAARGLRFRVSVFSQMTGPAAVFRIVKGDIIPLAKLGVPPIVATFAQLPNGLVLVGGPTGAGKSTTLAALIDDINRREARHIVTFEDPVEVVHKRNMSLINQREVGSHTRSFSSALRATLRQDPDVILIGELRDIDTIAFAVSAAETGHLVLATVHTTSADATVDRIINAFPARQQQQVRSMLAESLRAVTCQYLLPTKAGGRVLAVEVMINNDAIQTLIRKGKSFQIPSVMATSREQGMQLMDMELTRLAREGTVDVQDAYAKVTDKRTFEQALGLPPSDEDGDVPPMSGRAAIATNPHQPTTGRSQIAPTAARPSAPAPPRAGQPATMHPTPASGETARPLTPPVSRRS
ncbi:MAG: PilT/PilU family type 4a pilus ATPase [Polyangiaceae bacterium]